LLIGASAINDHGSVDGDAVATDISILFDVGADDLTASSAPTLDQIASLVAHGPVYVSLVARDTEILDPEKRKTLTDRRIAAFTRALARRGIAASRISSIWRPDSADSSIQRVAAGLQRLVRLRVG
jgi:outer membrane protein OmpA-like peptidoglycan-associated protein